MIYFDTSYIIKCYVLEHGTSRVLAVAHANSGRASCSIARAEFWAAIHRHLREGKLNSAQAGKVWRLFESDERNGLWHWLSLDQSVIGRACAMFERLPANAFLRSSDALHMSCAAENGFTEIYSNDRHMLASAQYFGLTGRNVI